MYVSQLRFIVYRILKMLKKNLKKKIIMLLFWSCLLCSCVCYPYFGFLFFFCFDLIPCWPQFWFFFSFFHFKFIILFANPYLNIFVSQAYSFAFGLVKNNSCLGKNLSLSFLFMCILREEKLFNKIRLKDFREL